MDAIEYLNDELPGRPGFRQNTAQVEYADSIATALAGGKGFLNAIEGSTGIGKSLGYLLPAVDWLADAAQDQRRQVIVSTYTRVLQQQLAGETNQTLVNDYQKALGRAPLRFAVRMGRSNYVSVDRLAGLIGVDVLADALTRDDLSPAMRRLVSWACTSDGCLLDLDDEMLPDGLYRSDIALTPDEPLPTHILEQRDAAETADIVVLNHAVLVNDLLYNRQRIDGDSTREVALIVDEGEHFPEVAREQQGEGLAFSEVARVAAGLGYPANAARWQAAHADFRDPLHAGQAIELSEPAYERLRPAIGSILKTPIPDPDQSQHHGAWATIRRTAKRLQSRLGHTRDGAVLTFSPVYGNARLVLHRRQAGAVIRLGLDQRTTIFTSATLSDIRNEGTRPSFVHLFSGLSFRGGDPAIGVCRHHEARDFGRLVFKTPTAPCSPLRESSDGYTLRDAYARYAVEQILSESPGRTLVLCNSYRDVSALAAFWPDHARPRLVTHPPGARLNAIANALGPNGIMVTPAGWEGLSPERHDEPFWKRLVILRNPRSPLDAADLLLRETYLRAQGHTPASAKQRASAYLFARLHTETLHRLRQGLGRALRHPDDQCEVVILDPRFRSDGALSNGRLTGLAAAIPQRFQCAFVRAIEGVNDLRDLPL